MENDKNVLSDNTVFLKRLKNLMKSHNLTQQELADKAGMSRTTVNLICNGKYNDSEGKPRKLNKGTLDSLANVLDVSVRYLIGESNYKKEEIESEYEKQKKLTTIRNDVKTRCSIIMKYFALYDLRIEYIYHHNNESKSAVPIKYNLYDADENKIKENDDLENILPIANYIITNLITGGDLISLYLQDAYILDYRVWQNEPDSISSLSSLRTIE